MTSGRKFLASVSLALLLVAASSVVAQPAQLAGFDEYALKAMKDWEVPGMAIAVVKDEKIVFAKGYGVKKIGEAAPVDDRTIFAIGSSSKAFTAATLAILAGWDDEHGNSEAG